MRKRLLTAALAAVVVGATPGSAIGQDAAAPEAVPNVGVTLGASAVRVVATGGLEAGPTRFTFSTRGSSVYRYGILYRIKPGRTSAQVQAALRRSTPRRFFSYVDAVVASSFVRRRDASRSLSVTLQASTTYAVVDATQRSHRRWRISSFNTTAETSTAVLPEPTATVVIRDRSMSATATTLPKRAVVRFDNAGPDMHSVDALRLRPGVSERQVRAALRRRDPRRLRALTVGSAYSALGLMNPGVVDAELSFPRTGRYVLICPHVSERGLHRRFGEHLFVTVA